MTSSLFVGHVLVFAVSALACFAALPRTRRITHDETRRGLQGLLVTCGAWGAAHVGYLLAPGRIASEAFYVAGLVCGLTAVGTWIYFAAAYTGRRPREAPFRWVGVGIFLGLIGLKVTNSFHHLYFTAELTAEPFRHLAVDHGALHWLALGLSYALSFVAFYMLLEHFYYAGSNTRPLVVLVGLTGLPLLGNVVGVLTPWLVAMTYEPVGVAVFAIGVLFVYFERFESISLVSDIDDPVVLLDGDDAIRTYNNAALCQFPGLEGAQGRPVDETMPWLADALAGDADVVAVERADGERRYFRVVTNSFLTGETTTGRTVVLSDVTESEQYRRQLERKSRQLAALNDIVRHDIRNDMTVVLGWSEALEPHVTEEGRDALDRILTKSSHVVEITEVASDIVDSLAEDGDADLDPIRLDARLLDDIETARDTHPEATFHEPEALPTATVWANEMLASVFRNLLNNAVEHNDADRPEVWVTVEERPATVVVRVADNGPGIPPATREAMFGKGNSGDDSEGAGLGLYLVRTLTDLYGGRVSVDDLEPHGTVFAVELEKTDPDEADGSIEQDGDRSELPDEGDRPEIPDEGDRPELPDESDRPDVATGSSAAGRRGTDATGDDP